MKELHADSIVVKVLESWQQDRAEMSAEEAVAYAIRGAMGAAVAKIIKVMDRDLSPAAKAELTEWETIIDRMDTTKYLTVEAETV